jgi:hypothetical protein
VLTDSQAEGIWFRIRFGTVKKPPPTLDALLDSLRGNWRVEGAAFELLRARDFLKMNECELVYSVGPKYGELAFFIYAVGKKPAGSQPAGTTQQLAEVNLSTTVILPESDTKPTALQGE